MREIAVPGGARSGEFAVPGKPADFAGFVADAWVRNGVFLGQGDAETDEAENVFLHDDTSGSLRARTYCDGKWTQVVLVLQATSAPELATTP